MTGMRKSLAWRLAKRLAADPLRKAWYGWRNRDKVTLFWYKSSNWGDALSPVLVRLLSGKEVIYPPGMYCSHYLAVGSILEICNNNSVVWGSGFIKQPSASVPRPRRVCAVRGPLTRKAFIEAGVDCPEVYGDPALLLPLFYNPDVPKRYRLGIIPHSMDKGHPWVQSQLNVPGVLVLDVESETWEFVRQVKSCEAVLSSSLHGLICADAYGIPNAWIRLSEDVIGGSFKFTDYRLSIGAKEPTPLVATSETPLDRLASRVESHRPLIDLRALLLSCPFVSRRILEWLKTSTTLLLPLPPYQTPPLAKFLHNLPRVARFKAGSESDGH